MYRIVLMIGIILCTIGCGHVPVPSSGKLPNLGSGLHRQSVSVPDVGKVKCAIRVDDAYETSTPAPLVLVLHFGYEGSRPDAYTGADMMEIFMEAVQEIGGVAIAPDAAGGDWRSSKNERSVLWLVKSAMNTYNIDSKQVYVMGYSMGGQGTWHIAGKHQDLFTGAIPVAAPVAGPTEWEIPVYSIHSKRDKVISFSAAKKHADSIEASGGTIHFESVGGLTHYDAGRYGSLVTEGVKWIRAQQP